jgi:hypothetical protein
VDTRARTRGLPVVRPGAERRDARTPTHDTPRLPTTRRRGHSQHQLDPDRAEVRRDGDTGPHGGRDARARRPGLPGERVEQAPDRGRHESGGSPVRYVSERVGQQVPADEGRPGEERTDPSPPDPGPPPVGRGASTEQVASGGYGSHVPAPPISCYERRGRALCPGGAARDGRANIDYALQRVHTRPWRSRPAGASDTSGLRRPPDPGLGGDATETAFRGDTPGWSWRHGSVYSTEDFSICGVTSRSIAAIT